jgi:titin
LLTSGAANNAVPGNYVGTDPSGNYGIQNSIGIEVDASSNTLGGTAAGAGNLISGNSSDGVLIQAPNVTVQGNYIGTNAAGTSALANVTGVEVNSSNVIVGGLVTSGASNVISGNNSYGILIDSGNSTVAVQGNYIGTDVTGSYAVANNGGVGIFGSYNTVGGTTTGARNVISGNSQYGVLTNTSGAGEVVQGNYIGTNAAGNAALANTLYGIWSYGPNEMIGGTTTAARNIISGNGSYGILLMSSSTGDMVQGDYIGTDVSGTVALPNYIGYRRLRLLLQ